MKNKITYLKRNKPTAAVKITDNKALHCYTSSIEVDGTDGDDTNDYFIDFYKGLGYVSATKEEFDTLFNIADEYIKELKKL